jgi:predicted HTH transcriptional regulator
VNLEEIRNRHEDERLELKSAEVLAKDPESVARGVVGMLNAKGGEIWIGVDEENERPAAINPVTEPEQARRRLWDYLVETMDPAPLPGEVVIDLESIQQDRAVLIVRIQPPAESSPRLPFAFRKKGGWHFVRRIGARNHPMTREEIFGARATGISDEAERGFETAVQAS